MTTPRSARQREGREGTRAIAASAAAARRAEREREYLEKLEDLRRQKLPTWPADFARRILGFRSKNALRRYPTLYRELHAYGLKMAPQMMRGGLGSTPPDVASSADAALVHELQAAIARLAEEKIALTSALDAERTAHQATRSDLSVVRAMVDALCEARIGGSAAVGREIDSHLRALARASLSQTDASELRGTDGDSGDGPELRPNGAPTPAISLVPVALKAPGSSGAQVGRRRGSGVRGRK